jgi:oligopeptide/dipeptide ABC transporter ATP-binding protein
LAIEDLRVRIGTPRGLVEPVRGVSLHVAAGESVAIVGESGSGKTVTALSVMRLLPADRTRIEATRLELCGHDLRNPSARELRRLRGRTVAMVFQDPMSSLNPVMKVGTQIAEAVRRADRGDRRQVSARVHALLASVEVDPERVASSYPHQLSGGMKQRVMIAIALAGRPELIIADEPTTALDVSTQAAILDLLKGLSRSTGTALLLVTHDLGVVARVAERVEVMYAGRVVETGMTTDLFERPRHPYTRGLLDSVPRMSDVRGIEFPAIPGSAPDVRAIPPGCPFAPRCGRRTAACDAMPPLVADPARSASPSAPTAVAQRFACWNPLEAAS